MLSRQGPEIVDDSGQPILLRGVGLGGWMNMENFITGFPGNEESWRAALLRELGEDRYRVLFDCFLRYFFGDADAMFLHSLGLNLLRIPINYRHFESDAEPLVIREEGFSHLDRVIDLCARHGIYTVIDLHAVQGYQNQDWHCDNPTHRALFWSHTQFQERATHLWEVIADRYRGNGWVAGYNLINEPYEPAVDRFLAVTRRLYDAVRSVDPDHLIFLDGNRYGSDLSPFTETWPGVVYSAHDYALCGFAEGGPYPGHTGSVWCDKPWLERHFLKKTACIHAQAAPVWIGEFGPVYTGDPPRDGMRYQLARDQIEIFERYRASWSIWTYKDIGLQGIVYAAPDSPYVRLLRPKLEKKARLGADSWGGLDTEVRQVMAPIAEVFRDEFPKREELPWDPVWMSSRLVRHILFAEALIPEFAALFRDLSAEDIDGLMRSFAFENCVKRHDLIRVLGEKTVAA